MFLTTKQQFSHKKGIDFPRNKLLQIKVNTRNCICFHMLVALQTQSCLHTKEKIKIYNEMIQGKITESNWHNQALLFVKP